MCKVCEKADAGNEKIYNAAVYLRLSREDNAEKEISSSGKTGGGWSAAESDSIVSQREIIFDYVSSRKDITVYDIYSDDGWSGTNFDRPAFRRMMSDIYAGKVNCVIVKDLSRLGRDYIEAGRLVQKIFPALQVRFIALTDGFDTLTADFNETSLIVPVKNFINDAYARDISDKVRSHQNVKRRNGEFIGAFAVYGYKKSPDNHNRLVIDEYPAYIVKAIFMYKLSGLSNMSISGKLNSRGILSPMEYKKLHGEKFSSGFLTGAETKWSAVSVKRILADETYLGTLVQGKEQKINYKINKSVKKPLNEWIRVEKTHEPVVSKIQFSRVQDFLELALRSESAGSENNRYAGILFCGGCNATMIRRMNRYKGREKISYICSAKNRGGCCGRHNISVQLLDKLVLEAVERAAGLQTYPGTRIYTQETAEWLDSYRELFGLSALRKIGAFRREIEVLRRELSKYIKIKQELGTDFKKGEVTDREFSDFLRIYNQKCEQLERCIRLQHKELKRVAEAKITSERKIDNIKKSLREGVSFLPDRAVILAFIRRITVCEDKRIRIELMINQRGQGDENIFCGDICKTFG